MDDWAGGYRREWGSEYFAEPLDKTRCRECKVEGHNKTSCSKRRKSKEANTPIGSTSQGGGDGGTNTSQGGGDGGTNTSQGGGDGGTNTSQGGGDGGTNTSQGGGDGGRGRGGRG